METAVTLAFENDADGGECALNTSVFIPAIRRTYANYLETVDGDTSFCDLIWLTRKWLSRTNLFRLGSVFLLPWQIFVK